MICAHCSTPVADEARFCHSCGSLVSDAEGQAAATASMDQSSFLNMERLLREDTKGVYNVQHMLGRGGMAVVYLATEIGLSRKVALKVLPPELTFGHGVERFKREAKTAAALDHPHIIPIYRIGDSGKLFWYAMKFLEGKSLEDVLREKGAMTLDETVDILEQVADALDYAHEHRVIHRDIKPANVMLDHRNRVIVTDFGIAKALSEGKLTATDSVIGTPYFMSPEQGMGKTVSGASDQYSVAVMAYRMLAGHVPFDGDSAIDILHKHCMFEAPSLHDDVPDIPEHVSAAVARALSKKGEERFSSVHDFIQAMKDPDFVPKEPPRASGVTVVMDASDAKKLRSISADKPASNTGKSKTVAAKPVGAKPADKTVVAGAQPGAAKSKAAAPAAPAPKSKAVLFATIGIAVIAGGGIAAWQLTKDPAQSPAPTDPAASAASTPTIPPPPAATTTDTTAQKLAEATTTPPVTPAETKTPTRVPDTKAATKSATAPTKSAPVPRQTATPAPVQTAPVQSAPAAAPATAPPTTPAATTGTLNLLLPTPGIVEIDGKDVGEKARYQTQLSEGTHVIIVRKEGYVTQTKTVEIKAGVVTPLRLPLEPRP